MKESEWIDPREKLPKIDQFVEVRFYAAWKPVLIKQSKFSINHNGFIGFISPEKLLYDIDRILGWRPIQEKTPDFSNLRKGDLIYFYLKTPEDCMDPCQGLRVRMCGFFMGTIEDVIHIATGENGWSRDAFGIDNIKKITRINIEDKTFEEI